MCRKSQTPWQTREGLPADTSVGAMSIAIMSALQDEIKLLVDRMKNVQPVTALRRVFYCGEIEGQKVVVVGSGVGKVKASACAQFLIDEFRIEEVIVFGLAGALDSRLNIGDIVISRKAIMHDYLVAGEGVNEEIRIDAIQADERLVELALLASANVAPKGSVHVGTVLTGDEAIADSGRKATLRQRFGGDCIEMEGAAAALVCSLNYIPFVIVRGISDLADEKAHQQFEDTFHQVIDKSAHVVLEMLRIISTAGRGEVAGRTLSADRSGP